MITLNPTLPPVPAIDASKTTSAGPLQWPSELPPSEQQGRCERSCLATCSLPVSNAEALCVDWELECTRLNVWRNKALESRQYVWASRYEEIIDAYSRCVKDLRREMVAATERQPEENA